MISEEEMKTAKDLFTIKKINLGSFWIYADNGVKAGEILLDVDGDWKFWPEDRGGYWPTHGLIGVAMHVIAINDYAK